MVLKDIDYTTLFKTVVTPPPVAVKTNNPSPYQITTIRAITTRLQKLGVKIPHIEDEILMELTGGKEGTAYELIEELIELEKETTDKLPLTKKQSELISQMLYCPDIDWSEYEVDDRFYLTDGRFKIMTRQEFEIELKNKITKKEATEFLERYMKTYNMWKQTRIRPNQEKVIRKYEDFLSSLECKRVRLVDTSIKSEEPKKKSLKEVYNPIAHVPLEDFQLKQFSIEEASKYMKQLRYEINAKRFYTFGKERNKDDDFEKLRSIKTRDEWATKELRTLHSILYSLQKESGVVNDQITHMIPYQDLYNQASKDDPFFTDLKKHVMIADYMYYIVSNHTMTFKYLKFKCQRSTMAMKCLEIAKKKLLGDKIYMESLLYQ